MGLEHGSHRGCRGRDHQSLCGGSFWKKVETTWNKDVQVGSEDRNDVAFTGQKISVETRSPNLVVH